MAVEIGTLIYVAASLVGTSLVLLSTILGWLVKQVWEIKTKEMSKQNKRLSTLEQEFRGGPGPSNGFVGDVDDELSHLTHSIDDLKQMIERNRREHRQMHYELGDALGDIIYVMEKHDLNGEDLPDEEDFEYGTRYQDGD